MDAALTGVLAVLTQYSLPEPELCWVSIKALLYEFVEFETPECF